MGPCLHAFGAKAECISPNICRGNSQSHYLHRAFAGAPELRVEALVKLLAIEMLMAGQLCNEL